MAKQEKIFLKKSFVVLTGTRREFGRSIALQFGAKFPPDSVIVLMDTEALESVRTELMASTPNVKVIIKQYDQGKTDSGYFDEIFDNTLVENKLSISDFDQALVVHNCDTPGDITKAALQLCDANQVRSYFHISLVGMILLNTSFFTTFSDPDQSRLIVSITSSASTRFKADKLLTPDEAVANLVQVLEDNSFDNAVTENNFIPPAKLNMEDV